MDKPRIIAFYLPQFHPIPENDKWWGKGFTEWTNVGKAKPLFKGHNQPRIPTELGYYDLRLPIVREQQAELAREAGVSAFCYWHYWFGNGKRLMEDVFDEVLHSGQPDFPFCLGWANHSWYSKNWNSDGTTENKLLIEQTYPGLEDAELHFSFLLKAFNDSRYVKIDNKPLLYVFAPQDLPLEYVVNFRKWAKKAGFPDLYLVGRCSEINITEIFSHYDAISYERLVGATKYRGGNSLSDRIIRRSQVYLDKMHGAICHRPPNYADYSKVYHKLICEQDYEENIIPSIVPQWDHTPRSGWNGSFFVNATPEFFYMHVKDALHAVKNKKNKIIFLKSWNEWGEGNMMEPDITYGKGFIEALRKALNEECSFN